MKSGQTETQSPLNKLNGAIHSVQSVEFKQRLQLFSHSLQTTPFEYHFSGQVSTQSPLNNNFGVEHLSQVTVSCKQTRHPTSLHGKQTPFTSTVLAGHSLSQMSLIRTNGASHLLHVDELVHSRHLIEHGLHTLSTA